MAEPSCAWCRAKPIDPVWRPFCSEWCKLLDLARWVDGAYRVAGEPALDENDEAAASGERRNDSGA